MKVSPLTLSAEDSRDPMMQKKMINYKIIYISLWLHLSYLILSYVLNLNFAEQTLILYKMKKKMKKIKKIKSCKFYKL